MLTFKDYISRIKIEEMAEHLGYTFDYKAGRGNSATYYLGNRELPSEMIVIDRNKQIYFNINGNKNDSGNLIHFVKNRLSQFLNCTEIGWDGVNQVLSQYLNCDSYVLPSQASGSISKSKTTKVFNLAEFYPKPLSKDHPYLTKVRKLSDKTVDAFLSKGLVYEVTYFSKQNVGFPFRNPLGAGDILNFEMRNYSRSQNTNFKGFCPGGDKTNSCWIANWVPLNQITDVYLFESGVDAMSFFELKHFTKETTAAFVSLGGNVGKKQIANLKTKFPSVNWFCCYDKDISGELFSIDTAYFLKDQPCSSSALASPGHQEKTVTINLEDKKEIFSEKQFNLLEYLKANELDNITVIQPEKGKDWNGNLRFYKQFESNFNPSEKIIQPLNEAISRLNLRGFTQLTTAIDQERHSIVELLICGDFPKITAPIAETGVYSMKVELNFGLMDDQFVANVNKVFIIDNTTQKPISAQPLYEFLQNEKIQLLKDFHSNDLRNFLSKNTLSIKKGEVEKSFEKMISPSGWGLKEILPIKKNSLDLGNSL